MDVWISITGTQRVEDEQQTLELTTAGQMLPTPEGGGCATTIGGQRGMEGSPPPWIFKRISQLQRSGRCIPCWCSEGRRAVR